MLRVVLNLIQSQRMSLIKSPLFSLSKVGRYVNEGWLFVRHWNRLLFSYILWTRKDWILPVALAIFSSPVNKRILFNIHKNIFHCPHSSSWIIWPMGWQTREDFYNGPAKEKRNFHQVETCWQKKTVFSNRPNPQKDDKEWYSWSIRINKIKTTF